MKKHQADSSPVRSLATAFCIVETLHERPRLTLTEIAEELDVATSTAHRHLATLREFGYVCKEDDQYRIGLRFLEVGERTRDRREIYQIAGPKIEQLAEETGEIIQLMVEEGGMGVRLRLEDGERGVPTNTLAGQYVFLHTNSTGKAILAHLPPWRREEIIERTGLPRQTENTLTDAEALRDELAEIRERGFAFNDEERIEGLRAVGTPVMGKNDEVVAAISVAGPSKRFNGDWFREELPSTISGAANEIELNLKYSRTR